MTPALIMSLGLCIFILFAYFLAFCKEKTKYSSVNKYMENVPTI